MLLSSGDTIRSSCCGSRRTPCGPRRIAWEIELETLDRRPSRVLACNDIGCVRLLVPDAILTNPYRRSPPSGNLVLIDLTMNEAACGGMVGVATP